MNRYIIARAKDEFYSAYYRGHEDKLAQLEHLLIELMSFDGFMEWQRKTFK